MGLGPRIVFLIDRYHGENNERLNNKIIANINLSCMRILSYYKHSYCTTGAAASTVSWGYKFFNSSKHQDSYHYKRYQFLEYSTCNFDKFENELYEGIYSQRKSLPLQKMNPGEKLKIALKEIITDFQWDQPELFSPGKMWKGGAAEKGIEVDHNFLFLFTGCPSVFYDHSTYFDQSFESEKSFIKCLFPEVLFKKFIKHLKIRLCWVDTGSFVSPDHFEEDNDHIMIENGMRSINGCFVEMAYLSSWWVYTGKKDNNVYNDMLNVSSLVGGLIDNKHDRNINITKYTFSHGSYNYALSDGSHDIALSHGSHNNATISLCSVLPEAVTTKVIAETLSINISKVVDLKTLSINMLLGNSGYFYVVNPTLSEDNKKFYFNLHETFLSEKVIEIEFIPPDCSEVCSAFMFPYTLFCGTIMVIANEVKCDTENPTSKMNCGEEELNDVTKEMEFELSRYLNDKEDLGASFVNSVDTWFLSNPKLGFPLELKNILCSLFDGIMAMKKKREDNSKLLVEYMKDKLKPPAVSNKRRKNISRGKRRLTEYRRQLKEEKSEDSNVNMDAILKEGSESPVNVELENEVQSRDKLNSYTLAEYEEMLKESELSRVKVANIISTTVQYYKSVDVESYKESSHSFLASAILRNVEEIRDKNIDTPKEELVKEYLLQVQLYLECLYQLTLSDTESILDQVVSFLRTVSFEKSTTFVRKHLNEKILPCFQDMTTFLHEVYDNLMLDFPEELDESKDALDDDNASVRSVENSSVISYVSSEHSPVSLQAEKRTLKRLPSIVGDNVNKKVIAVQVKKTSNKNKDKKKCSSESSDKVVKRTLFSQNPPLSNVLATPKPRRRHSESVLKKRVPDTPETKQINDMIWKKLERKRRHSNIDKKMVTIEESPLKEIASPIKRHSSFYRSSSFNCHTSPRRFYTIQRHPSMLVGSHGFSKVLSQEELKLDVKQNESDKVVLASPMEVKLRRRSTLFSNFDNNEMEVENESEVLPTFGKENCSKATLRRNIFDLECTPVKQKQDSFSPKFFEEENQDRKRCKLSLNNETAESMTENRNNALTRHKSDMSSVLEDSDEQPVFMTETTVDWLSEIEKDQLKTPTNFHDAFAMLSDTPPCKTKQSPAIVKAGNVSIKVSPCLSASSIECLEKAPIISPVIKRKVPRKKGRLLNL